MFTTITQLLEQKFRDAFDHLGFAASFPVILKESARPEFGDYQVNGIMAIAKSMGVKARDLAAKVIAQINVPDVIARLDVAGPGFINITVTDKCLSNMLSAQLLHVKSSLKQRIVIDYSSPNLAKEMHVGHLRSTIIGDALVRLYEFLGHDVIRRNHVGDWGTQFGMLTAHLLETVKKGSNAKLALNDLEEFYRQAKARFDNDPEFAKLARDYVVKLQTGDKEVLALWQQFVQISLEHCQRLYTRLGVKLQMQDVVGESAYNDVLPTLVNDLVAKGIAVDDAGAKCVFFTQDEIATHEEVPFIVQKQDGAYLYATTDIAALCDRVQKLQANYLLYVIDSRQSLHLNQLFALAKKAHFVDDAVTLEHVSFGMMLGADHKPFKTRTGGTIKLMDLLDEATTRAAQIVHNRNPEWTAEQINKVAEVLGIAAIKYADLVKHRNSDYVFDFNQMLAFEGNTAPYMLYAYVRINSIFRKLQFNLEDYLDKQITIYEPTERMLALHLVRFPEYMLQAARENYPHYVCSYIYALAGFFMGFYETCSIVKAEDHTKQQSRLALAALTAKVLATSLGVLGINLVDRM